MVTEGAGITSIALMGGVNLTYSVICIFISIIAMLVGYVIFDKLTSFKTATELKDGNIAVAIFNGLIVLGIGICSGLVIGMAVN